MFAWFLVPRLQVISRWSKRILANFSFQFDQFDWRQQMKIIHHPPRPFLQGTCYAYGQSFHPKDRFFHFWVVGFLCSLVSRRPEQRNHLRNIGICISRVFGLFADWIVQSEIYPDFLQFVLIWSHLNPILSNNIPPFVDMPTSLTMTRTMAEIHLPVAGIRSGSWVVML